MAGYEMHMVSDLGDRVWFTADHHFGHENIIKFCNRPFASAQEMDEAMIERWNSVVKPDDKVYHLGDFTLNNAAAADHYFKQLNGRIYVRQTPPCSYSWQAVSGHC
jgi:calcineurin-like phosphoesterase family protein